MDHMELRVGSVIEVIGGRGIKSPMFDVSVHTEVFRKPKSHALRCASRRGRERSRLQKISCCANAAGLPVAM